MKQLLLPLLVFGLCLQAAAQYEAGKLAIGLSDDALVGITIEEDGSATLECSHGVDRHVSHDV